jgi:hypothetical protein
LDPPTEEYRVKKIALQVRNVGKGIGILTEWVAQCEPVPELPESPLYSNAIKNRGRLFKHDESETFSIHLTNEQTEAICGDHATAYLWGYFKYEDVFGRLHQTGFGYVGHPYSSAPGAPADGLEWGRIGGKAYNYDKEVES